MTTVFWIIYPIAGTVSYFILILIFWQGWGKDTNQWMITLAVIRDGSTWWTMGAFVPTRIWNANLPNNIYLYFQCVWFGIQIKNLGSQGNISLIFKSKKLESLKEVQHRCILNQVLVIIPYLHPLANQRSRESGCLSTTAWSKCCPCTTLHSRYPTLQSPHQKLVWPNGRPCKFYHHHLDNR